MSSFLLGAPPGALSSGPRTVWVDTDLALGAWRGDVDDGYALAAILAAPDVQLLGISTVSGNAPSDVAYRCGRALLQATGRSHPLIQGASRPGQDSAAAEAIAALPEGSAVLALGPLSNIAAALRRDPRLAERITVYLVGGNLQSWGRFPPVWPHEFNLAIDAPAAAAVFSAPLRRRVHPLPGCGRLLVSPIELARIAAASPLGAYLVRHSLRWLSLSPFRLRALRFPLWDLAPALDFLGLLPARVDTQRVRLQGRGLLRLDASASPSEFVYPQDIPTALSHFRQLLAASRL
ncbi:MAG TPA: nucleoside hydrolase [Pseudomonadota bacterium]|nr:nucleoside hydrolase [Pseudomonadota bacterium]